MFFSLKYTAVYTNDATWNRMILFKKKNMNSRGKSVLQIIMAYCYC